MGNTLATAPGSIVSFIGSFCFTRFGSYAPMYVTLSKLCRP